MKEALKYKQKYLQNQDGDMFSTFNSLIQLNNLIIGANNTEQGKVNVKPARCPKYCNPNYPWHCIESSLYILLDNFNDRFITKIFVYNSCQYILFQMEMEEHVNSCSLIK